MTDVSEKQQRLEKVVSNRVKRLTRDPHSDPRGGGATTTVPPSEPSIPTLTPSLTLATSTPITSLTPSPVHLSVCPSQISSLQFALLPPDRSNLLLSIFADSSSPLGVAGVGGVARVGGMVTSVLDSQLVRRLTADETHMVHELNQVFLLHLITVEVYMRRTWFMNSTRYL